MISHISVHTGVRHVGSADNSLRGILTRVSLFDFVFVDDHHDESTAPQQPYTGRDHLGSNTISGKNDAEGTHQGQRRLWGCKGTTYTNHRSLKTNYGQSMICNCCAIFGR